MINSEQNSRDFYCTEEPEPLFPSNDDIAVKDIMTVTRETFRTGSAMSASNVFSRSVVS